MPKTIKKDGSNTNPDKDTYTVRVYKKLTNSGNVIDNHYPFELRKIYGSAHASIPMVDRDSDFIEVEIPKVENNFEMSVNAYFSEGKGKNISGYIDYPFSKTGDASDMTQPLHEDALGYYEDQWKNDRTYDRSNTYGTDGKDSSGEALGRQWFGPFKPVNLKQPDGLDTEDGNWAWNAENWREGDWEKTPPPPPPPPPPSEEKDIFSGLRSGYPGDIYEPPPSDWTGTGRLFEQIYVQPNLPMLDRPASRAGKQFAGGRVKVLKSR